MKKNTWNWKTIGLIAAITLGLLTGPILTVIATDVGAGANLVVTSVSGPTQAFLNQTISIICEVKNQGDEASEAYKVRLYLSKDMTIDPAKDRLLKEISFPGGLSAGQTKKITTKVTIPIGELSGLYYYGGVVGSSSIASVKKVSIVRFQADSVNGTVTDHKTGLMWQQGDEQNNQRRTLFEAKTYCNGLVLGGHEDWSLPRIDQLLTIVDYSRYEPAINPAFDCRSGEITDYYWSSSTFAGGSDLACIVYFGNGFVGFRYKVEPLYVRCVRGGPW